MTTGDLPRAPPSAETGELVDWRLLLAYVGYVLRSPGRHKLLAAACFLAVLAATAGAYKVLPKRWEVRASVLAQPNPLSLEFDKYDAPTRAAREIVLRRDNVVSLVVETDFVARHERARAPAARAKAWLFERLRGPRTPQQQVEDAADAVEDRLSVGVSNSGTVDFTFEWADRDLAFDVVEAAIQSFLEARYASDVSRLGETIALLEEHASRVNQEVSAKTKEVEALERELRPQGPRRVAVARGPVRDEDLLKLEARLSSKRRALADMEEFRQRRVAELQSQLQQQEAIYAEQHPALATTKRNIEALLSRSPQVETLRTEVADLEREVKRRGARPEAPQRDPAPVMPGEVGTSVLVEDPRLEYERHKLWLLIRQHSGLLERIDSARVQMDTARAGFKYRYSVVSPPQLPKRPVKPHFAKMLVAGVVGAFSFAFLAAVAADLRARVLLERWEVEARLGLPLLGEVGGHAPRAPGA